MNKALASVALVLAGLLSVAGIAPAAQGYPEIAFEAEVTDKVVYEFQSFIASSEASVECDWTHEWNGKEQKGSGKEYDSTWEAPEVSETVVIPVHLTCEYDGSGTAGRAALVAAETWSRTVNVTVLSRGGDAKAAPAAQSALPGTGGPGKHILIGGLLLLVIGVIAATAARRRGAGPDADADPQA